ncbi:MAG: CheY-like chemotaxis protein [Pseudohongiellaceae bacterium]
MNDKLKVLIVDDELTITNILRRIVEKLGCEVTSVDDGREVGKAVVAYNPEVIFLDLMMPDIDGVQTINLLGEAGCKAKIILMSGLDQRTISSVAAGAKNLNLDVLAAITKPFKPGQIEGLLEPVIASRTELDSNSPSMETEQQALQPGPQVSYTPEKSLIDSSSGDDICWNRAQLVWILDDDQLINFTDILEGSKKALMSKGLMRFFISLLAKRQPDSSLDSSAIGFKVPLPLEILMDASAPNFLEECVNQAGLNKQAVSFEISETTIVGQSDLVLNTLSRLKIKGFKLSVCIRSEIDNVLLLLNKLPLDELVLDMSDDSLQGPFSDNSELDFQVGSLVSFALKNELVATAINISSSQQLNLAKKCNFHRVSGKFLD